MRCAEPGLVLIALGYTAQTVVTFLAGKRLRDEIARVQPQPLGAGGSAQQLVPVVDAQVLEAASAQPAQQQAQQVSQQPPSQEQQSDARSQRAPAQPRQPPVTMASHPGSTPPRDAGQQYQYDLFLTHGVPGGRARARVSVRSWGRRAAGSARARARVRLSGRHVCLGAAACADWGLNSENHQRVSRVNEALKARGYRTWFDTEKMHGNIHDQMTAGIDMSELVIVFVTNRYTVKVASSNHNDNCKVVRRATPPAAAARASRTPHHSVCGSAPRGCSTPCAQLEFNYAKMQKTAGRMIPVVMEPDMRNTSRWKGMVGLILGSELHVDMSADDAPTRAHLDELDELIKRKREAIAALAAQGMAT